MHRTITRWDEFARAWDGVTNFLMSGECAPFSFDLPPFVELLDRVRHDDEAHVNPAAKGDQIDATEITDAFRRLPIEEAIRSEYRLAHYNIWKWDAPGEMLEGFRKEVVEPFKLALGAQGFTWEWFREYFFISGPNSATNYHMDKSNVIAWQRYGTKIFSGLEDPDHWEPLERRMQILTEPVSRPPDIGDKDVLAYEMNPGDVLWNALLTPHWVDASDEPACSINFSLRGLRHRGRLCRHEQELVERQKSHPG